MKEKSLILVPGKEYVEADEIEGVHERLIDAETALRECHRALHLIFTWHQSKKSRSSEQCDKAMHQVDTAGTAVMGYLNKHRSQQS